MILQTIDTAPAQPKLRRIRIIKALVDKDVELYTYKYKDAQALPTPQQADAVAADVAETLDGGVMSRYLRFRDAELRRLLSAYLQDGEHYKADDELGLDEMFVYPLALSPSFKDVSLRPLAEYIHRYLVWGVLYDWYSGMGLERIAAKYKDDLDRVEEDMMDVLRTPSIVKKPLQPFGPAEKFR